MIIAKPKTRKIAKTNLKKSIAFGGTLGAISAVVGLSIVIPTYIAIQKELASSIERFSDISDFLVQLARMLGIKPGEDFQSDLENGYVVEITSVKDDGSMTLVFRKTGAPATLIINIDANGNLTSAGEIYGPAASDILNSINSAADIFEKDAEAMDEILGSVNEEIDFNSLKIEYVLRRNFVETMIDDLDIEGKLPLDKYSYGDWLDFGIASLLVARNIKNEDGEYADNTPQSIIDDLKDPDKASGITDPTKIKSITDLLSFVDDDSYEILELIAKALIDLEISEQESFDNDGFDGIEDSLGGIFDSVGDELDSEKESISADLEEKAQDIVQDINDAKDDLVIENAGDDITLLYKLIEKPSLWIPAYLKTDSLKEPLKEAIVRENKMSAASFDALVSELGEFDLTVNENNIEKLSVIEIANTYNLTESSLASLVGLKFEVSYNDNTKKTSILLGLASSLSVNDLREVYVINDAEDANQWETVNLYLDQYYEHSSEVLWRNSIVELKEISAGTNVWEHPKLNSNKQVENISDAYRYASRIRDDENKKNLALSIIDKIAYDFYFKSKTIKFTSDDFVNAFDNLLLLEGNSNSIIQNPGTSIYSNDSKFTDSFVEYINNFVSSTDKSSLFDFDKFFTSFDSLISRIDSRQSDNNVKDSYLSLVNNEKGWKFTYDNMMNNMINDYVLLSWDEFIKPTHWDGTGMDWESVFIDDDIWNLAVESFNSTPDGNNPQVQKVLQIQEYLRFFGQGGIDKETVEKLNKTKEILTILENNGVEEDDANSILDLVREIIRQDSDRVSDRNTWLKNNPGMSEDDYTGPRPLSLDDVDEIVSYNQTIFDITTFTSLAIVKLNHVFSEVGSNGSSTIFEKIEYFETLNTWVDELSETNNVINDETIIDYVWHKDPVLSSSVEYLPSSNSSRPLMVGATYSEYTGKTYSISHENNPVIIEMELSGDKTITNHIDMPNYVGGHNSTPLIYESSKHKLLISSELNPNNGIIFIDLTKPIDGTVIALSNINFPAQENVRNMHIDEKGRLIVVSDSGGDIYRTAQSLEDWDGADDKFVFDFVLLNNVANNLDGVYASELMNIGGKDYVVMSNTSLGTSPDNGTHKTYLLSESDATEVSVGILDVSMASITSNSSEEFAYGIAPSGEIWKIDPLNIDNSELMIQLNKLESINNIGSTPIWGTTEISDKPHATSNNGFRNIYYNPHDEVFVIYGAGDTPRDIYIPDMTDYLDTIIDYLVK